MFIETKLLWECGVSHCCSQSVCWFLLHVQTAVLVGKESYSVFSRVCCIMHHIPTAISYASPLSSIVFGQLPFTAILSRDVG